MKSCLGCWVNRNRAPSVPLLLYYRSHCSYAHFKYHYVWGSMSRCYIGQMRYFHWIYVIASFQCSILVIFIANMWQWWLSVISGIGGRCLPGARFCFSHRSYASWRALSNSIIQQHPIAQLRAARHNSGDTSRKPPFLCSSAMSQPILMKCFIGPSRVLNGPLPNVVVPPKSWCLYVYVQGYGSRWSYIFGVLQR